MVAVAAGAGAEAKAEELAVATATGRVLTMVGVCSVERRRRKSVKNTNLHLFILLTRYCLHSLQIYILYKWFTGLATGLWDDYFTLIRRRITSHSSDRMSATACYT